MGKWVIYPGIVGNKKVPSRFVIKFSIRKKSTRFNLLKLQ